MGKSAPLQSPAEPKGGMKGISMEDWQSKRRLARICADQGLAKGPMPETGLHVKIFDVHYRLAKMRLMFDQPHTP
jgi:hypothetical protein